MNAASALPPSLGKPVLVMRDTTERPEAVLMGTVKLVGREREQIVTEAARPLMNESLRKGMAQLANPYGDRLAAGRITRACREFLQNPCFPA